jgi:eukaryotic-like serine/threonine-protein kinase
VLQPGAVEALILAIIFAPFFYAIKRRYDLRELNAKRDPKLLTEVSEVSRELEAMREERRLLQERIENLESIVCSVDYELNLRLAGLAAQPALSAAPPDSGNARPATGAVGVDSTALRPGMHASAPRAASLELAVGDRMGERYRIERLLGRGGMGAVYLAHDETLGETVALKVISAGLTEHREELQERFRREASAARRVSSPNVIRIHDLGVTGDGRPYISMEYFPGTPLSQVMTARGTLDSGEGRDILAQVCDGLEAAHKAGVIHRDLKPQNVLVGPRNAVKLIDFGLAKSSFMPELTATGLIMGTPHYMSPEQIRGRVVDARSDIYSLGALTYHAMTGRTPFDGPTPIAIGFAQCSETPAAPRTVRPALSVRLNDMILAALAKSPGDRPQSAAEFRAALAD